MINFSGWRHARAAARVSIAAALLLGCGGAQHTASDREALESDGRLWVLAPHPDDEVLMAGELLRAAVRRGRPISVIVMTNGDLSCTRDGHARQGETIAALRALGVRESDVHFLGYPDGWLDALGPVPLDPLPRTAPDGSCGTGDHTYASRGAGGLDVHTRETGAPGAYTASNLEGDLALLLRRERPTEIATSHGIDAHPDHAMTYVYLRRALERAAIAPPHILRSVVHQGPCWPDGAGEPPCPDVITTQGTPSPSLAPPLDRYVPTLRIASTDGGLGKRAAIALYTTQLGAPTPPESWLSAFARTDEAFWDERLVRDERSGQLGRARSTEGVVHAALLTRPGELTVHYVAPFVLRVATQMTDPTGTARIELLDDAAFEILSLTLDGGAAAIRSGETVLHQVPLPHGEDPTLAHTYELRVDPEPAAGNVAEVLLRRDGVVWATAVLARSSPEPTRSGLETSRDAQVPPSFGGEHVRWHVERGVLGTPALVE